jgi:hypothetical protein
MGSRTIQIEAIDRRVLADLINFVRSCLINSAETTAKKIFKGERLW